MSLNAVPLFLQLMTRRFPQKQVIIVGGSIAGLLAARVASDTFGKVTIIERDTMPDGATERKGVPQSPLVCYHL